ncbi:ATP-dependent Clp protease ATP-binding subunit ClpA [Striga asiatica]|uniref:ATP-dependent Clp protease ATP-binding subunit ClpA n=1 Tax=Striga asiatica TaxID=4170 RepID=A0A5A7PCD6_STRAF|nr:ATP-dependent Clp protease ATP-binding subunit ClpA [Striga asiatica]
MIKVLQINSVIVDVDSDGNVVVLSGGGAEAASSAADLEDCFLRTRSETKLDNLYCPPLAAVPSMSVRCEFGREVPRRPFSDNHAPPDLANVGADGLGFVFPESSQTYTYRRRLVRDIRPPPPSPSRPHSAIRPPRRDIQGCFGGTRRQREVVVGEFEANEAAWGWELGRDLTGEATSFMYFGEREILSVMAEIEEDELVEGGDRTEVGEGERMTAVGATDTRPALRRRRGCGRGGEDVHFTPKFRPPDLRRAAAFRLYLHILRRPLQHSAAISHHLTVFLPSHYQPSPDHPKHTSTSVVSPPDHHEHRPPFAVTSHAQIGRWDETAAVVRWRIWAAAAVGCRERDGGDKWTSAILRRMKRSPSAPKLARSAAGGGGRSPDERRPSSSSAAEEAVSADESAAGTISIEPLFVKFPVTTRFTRQPWRCPTATTLSQPTPSCVQACPRPRSPCRASPQPHVPVGPCPATCDRVLARHHTQTVSKCAVARHSAHRMRRGPPSARSAKQPDDPRASDATRAGSAKTSCFLRAARQPAIKLVRTRESHPRACPVACVRASLDPARVISSPTSQPSTIAIRSGPN